MKRSVLIALACIASAWVISIGFRMSGAPRIEDRMIARQTAETTDSLRTKVFSNVRLTAQAAYVLDATDGSVLYAKDEHKSLPLASLTKAMTALVATEQSSPQSVVVVRRDDVMQEGDSGLRSGERFTLRDLVNFTLVSSSNDGAHALAASAGEALSSTSTQTTGNDPTQTKSFVDLMNTRARELGLTDTTYRNPTGLDEDSQTAGSYGSARDMAYLFAYIMRAHPEILAATIDPEIRIVSLEKNIHTATNTDEVVGKIPGIIGSKTGYTALAGGNLAVAVDAGIGHPIIIVVLGSTPEGRFLDTETLAHAVMASILKP